MNSNTITSSSVEQTLSLGRTLGQAFVGGEVVALTGTLGTGKTHLIKGMANGLDITDTSVVTSPTFTLINEYTGRLTMYHIDAYRLDNADQLEVLGFDEICRAGGVVVVEWADRVQTLVNVFSPIVIELEHSGETERIIHIKGINITNHGTSMKNNY